MAKKVAVDMKMLEQGISTLKSLQRPALSNAQPSGHISGGVAERMAELHELYRQLYETFYLLMDNTIKVLDNTKKEFEKMDVMTQKYTKAPK